MQSVGVKQRAGQACRFSGDGRGVVNRTCVEWTLAQGACSLGARRCTSDFFRLPALAAHIHTNIYTYIHTFIHIHTCTHQFDEGSRCEPGGARATALVRDAQKKMDKYVHVDRYIRPYMPSGSSFMRNPPPPLEACYPLGIPDSVLEEFKSIPKEVEVDMSKPEDGRMSRAGQVLVDLATKRVY
ncbi:unnamed protein product [Ascophyllum nodosum]